MYDCIIVGAGPAGLTAGIYTARKNIKTLILTQDIGGQMSWSSGIENYSGYSLISGTELAEKFKEQAENLSQDLEIITGVTVTHIDKNITSFSVEDASGKVYYGKTVIIATGRKPKFLGIPGEKDFLGKGVSICTTCDAPLYRNKSVAVIGGGNSAMEAVWSLSHIARQVYVITNAPKLTADPVLVQKVASLPHISFMYSTHALEILGDSIVTGLVLQKSGNTKETLPVQGVFIEIGYEPHANFEHLSNKTAWGAVIVDSNLQTSTPGLFAAGDVNDAWGEQIIIAAGEGAKAAMSVAKFLHR